jgi:hypothetical protein
MGDRFASTREAISHSTKNVSRDSVEFTNGWLTQSVPPGSNITQAKPRSEAFDDGGGI